MYTHYMFYLRHMCLVSNISVSYERHYTFYLKTPVRHIKRIRTYMFYFKTPVFHVRHMHVLL